LLQKKTWGVVIFLGHNMFFLLFTLFDKTGETVDSLFISTKKASFLQDRKEKGETLYSCTTKKTSFYKTGKKKRNFTKQQKKGNLPCPSALKKLLF
jgi:hypothetical protein